MAKRDVIDSVIREMAGQPRFGCDELPDRKVITGIISDVQAFMFPAFSSGACVSERMLLEKIRWELAHQIRRAMRFAGDSDLDPDRVADDFLAAIPGIYSLLLKDIEALYEGDPAATSREEVIVAYPGFFAIVVYRIAHVLYEMRVPIIPRIMTEFVHQKTGIDIHAGAKIGEYFFIDHGTGIVIGATTEIGDDCLLYQNVTLGGTGMTSGKRHPTLGNNVMVGSGAKVLGPFKVGDNARIAANSVVLHEVPPDSTVVGVPGRVVRRNGEKLDHIHTPDPVRLELDALYARIEKLEEKLKQEDQDVSL